MGRYPSLLFSEVMYEAKVTSSSKFRSDHAFRYYQHGTGASSTTVAVLLAALSCGEEVGQLVAVR